MNKMSSEAELKVLSLQNLKLRAKEVGLTGYSKYKAADRNILINLILDNIRDTISTKGSKFVPKAETVDTSLCGNITENQCKLMLKQQLKNLAKACGVSTTGNKMEICKRIMDANRDSTKRVPKKTTTTVPKKTTTTVPKKTTTRISKSSSNEEESIVECLRKIQEFIKEIHIEKDVKQLTLKQIKELLSDKFGFTRKRLKTYETYIIEKVSELPPHKDSEKKGKVILKKEYIDAVNEFVKIFLRNKIRKALSDVGYDPDARYPNTMARSYITDMQKLVVDFIQENSKFKKKYKKFLINEEKVPDEFYIQTMSKALGEDMRFDEYFKHLARGLYLLEESKIPTPPPPKPKIPTPPMEEVIPEKKKNKQIARNNLINAMNVFVKNFLRDKIRNALSDAGYDPDIDFPIEESEIYITAMQKLVVDFIQERSNFKKIYKIYKKFLIDKDEIAKIPDKFYVETMSDALGKNMRFNEYFKYSDTRELDVEDDEVDEDIYADMPELEKDEEDVSEVAQKISDMPPIIPSVDEDDVVSEIEREIEEEDVTQGKMQSQTMVDDEPLLGEEEDDDVEEEEMKSENIVGEFLDEELQTSNISDLLDQLRDEEPDDLVNQMFVKQNNIALCLGLISI